MPRISVIIPVCNTEAYLRRCLDSLLNHFNRGGTCCILNRFCHLSDQLIHRLGDVLDSRSCEKVGVHIHDNRVDIEGDGVLLSVESAGLKRCSHEIVDREIVGLEVIVQGEKLSARNIVQKVSLMTDNHVGSISGCERCSELRVVVIELHRVVLELDVGVCLVELIDDCIEELSISTCEQGPECHDPGTGSLGLGRGLCEQRCHAK